jgi:multidrug efflux pump subunit AcrB
VELENIHRHLAMEQGSEERRAGRRKEVAMPILVSTITTIVVFFPVLFLQGVARDAFVPLALTIAFSLGDELFGLAHRDPSSVPAQRCAATCRETRGLAGAVTALVLASTRPRYARILRLGAAAPLTSRWVHRARLRAVALAVAAGSGSEFFPQTDEAQVNVQRSRPIGTRVERSEEVAKRIETPCRRCSASRGENPPATRAGPAHMRVNAGCRRARRLLPAQRRPHSGSVSLNLVPRSARKRATSR